ncbi:MAG: membrane integrity-associated transporter subunit PqiC [Candidatus Hydrogenedentes bacterium]|nr:membrane integrity-associated transporter subunit PqiC [Candidatus Hydrogenedentota bacterium]
MRRLAVLALAALAVSCARSPVPRYYTLDMTRSAGAAPGPALEVGRLRTHDALSRADILIKKSPTEIEYYAAHRWAAPLEELIREKLDVEFGARAADADASETAGAERLILSGVVLAFEQVDAAAGAEAHIKLDLAFRPSGASAYDAPLFERVYETSVAAAADPCAVVEALSRALEELAAQIRADAARIAEPPGQ